MRISGISLMGAALLLTLGMTAATVETVAAAPTVSVAASNGEFTVAQYDRRYDRRDNRYRYRARCRTDIHYGWSRGRCVRVQQQVCRNRNGRTYVTNRYVTRASRFHCR